MSKHGPVQADSAIVVASPGFAFVMQQPCQDNQATERAEIKGRLARLPVFAP